MSVIRKRSKDTVFFIYVHKAQRVKRNQPTYSLNHTQTTQHLKKAKPENRKRREEDAQ